MQVPHCASSRFVLGHYYKCKEPKCLLCGPVRATLAREKDEQRLAGRTDSSSDEDESGAEAAGAGAGASGDVDEDDDDDDL